MSSSGRDNCLLSDVRVDSQDTYEDLEPSTDWSGYRLIYRVVQLNFTPELEIQGVTCPRRLGFVELDLGCSTTLLGQ